ncbi:hypothetical protein TNCV_1057411 [Trichonephila clavipes]|nr:hypothetical protein TNCV_1057411 [Trichonephila clavipes]
MSATKHPTARRTHKRHKIGVLKEVPLTSETYQNLKDSCQSAWLVRGGVASGGRNQEGGELESTEYLRIPTSKQDVELLAPRLTPNLNDQCPDVINSGSPAIPQKLSTYLVPILRHI